MPDSNKCPLLFSQFTIVFF